MLPGALEALISRANWLVKLNPSYSCSLDVSSSAVQQDLVWCSVTVDEQCKILISSYTEKAITAYSLSIKNLH